MMIWDICLVGLGGFFGAISRSYIGNLIGSRFSSAFPYGTLTINLSGSFLLGFTFGWFPEADSALFLLASSGFLGAFTTFSTIQVESLMLANHGRWQAVMLYSGVTYSAGITLALIGYLIGKQL